ncbi:MAG: hypothetical protein VZR78_04765, partial [Candidatus Enteromonas sp.]|nr:hypothetical protein [Candidatus Enteromonas sp.]
MKKVVKFLALPLFASMILAACGGNEGDNGDSSSAAPTNSSVETPVSSSEAPKVSSSQEAPVVSSSTAPVASSTKENPPASSSSQQEQHEHAYGDWTVVSEPTETEDGVESRSCSCGDTQTRPIPRKQLKVDYGFSSETNYTMTTSTRGLSYKVSGGDAYGGLSKSFTTNQIANAIKYTFKIKNDGASRIELRFGYRNTSVQPRTFSNSSDASKYTLTSRDSSSNTKIREVKDGYFKMNIAAGDIADIAIPMVDNLYDQFVLTAVHTEEVNFTIIETGYVTADLHYSETYSSDDTHHWKTCTDEGYGFISEKGAHEWVADDTKTDIPATTEAEGVHYEKCSVCGKTREVVIPRLGAPTYQEVNILSHGINNNDHYTSTAMEDGSIKVDFTQNSGKYEPALITDHNTFAFTNAEYTTVKLTNLGSEEVVFCPMLYSDGSTSALVKGNSENSGVLISSEKGTSSFERVGSTCAYLHVGANDTAEFKVMIAGNPTSFAKMRFMCDPNPSGDKSGSIKLISWTIHD